MSLLCLMTVSAFALVPCLTLRFDVVLSARNLFRVCTPPVALKYLTIVAAKQSLCSFDDRASLRKNSANLSVAAQSLTETTMTKCVYF